MNKFNEIIASDKLVLVDFHATWCGPCKMMSPILEQVKTTLGDAVTIIKIDVDKNMTLAQQQGVKSVPTLKIFNKGVEKWKGAGVHQTKQLVSIINSLQ